MSDSNGSVAMAEATATPRTRDLKIPPTEITRARVRIEGRTPLITHRFSEEAQEKMAGDQQKVATNKRPPRDPEREGRAALYLLPVSEPDRYTAPLDLLQCAFPGVGLKRAIVLGGMRATTLKSTEVNAAIAVDEDHVPIECAAGPRIRTDRVRLHRSTTSMSYRPCFDVWAMEFGLGINERIVTLDAAINAVTQSGFAVGIGDWRVEKNGTFGTFSVTQVTVIEEG